MRGMMRRVGRQVTRSNKKMSWKKVIYSRDRLRS